MEYFCHGEMTLMLVIMRLEYYQKFYQGFGDRGDVVQENINCVGVGFGEGIRRGGEGVKHGLAHRGVRGGEVVEGGRRGGVRNARANELEGLEN